MKKKDFLKGWTEIYREGDGVFALRVYGGPEFLALLQSARPGDSIVQREIEGVTHMLRQFYGGQQPPCWICGGVVTFPQMVVLLCVYRDDPSRGIGGFICPDCCDPNANMVQRAAAMLKKEGLTNREFIVHPQPGHT